MKKKILSVLMSIVLLFGILPVGANALSSDSIITDVFLEMDRYPVAGEGLVYPEISDVYNSSGLLDAAVSLTFTKWYSAENYSLDGTTYGGFYDLEFIAGRAYNLNVELTPEEGYVFAADCTVVLVVGGDQFFSGYLYEWEGNIARYDFFFNLTGEPAVLSDAVMELSEMPALDGDVLDYEPWLASLDENDEYLMPLDYRAFWCYYDEDDDTYYGEDDSFREGYQYALFIDVFAREEYLLAQDFTISLETPEGLKSGDLLNAKEMKSKRFAFYFGKLGQNQIINEISLIAFLLPEAGGNPFRYSVATINGSADLKGNASVETWWGEYDSTEQVYLPHGSNPFEAGKKYAAELFVYAAEGYEFAPECSITILNPTGERPYTLQYADEVELDISIFYPAILLSQNPFIDVKTTDYFSKAVLWAVSNEITAGTSSNQFSPSMICDRAQVVSFLWRAAGKPEPQTSENPFTDVKPTNYYYKAVLWAAENNITAGTAADKFSPNMSCDRAQIVTFLYRFAAMPEPQTSENPFTDVRPTDYYYKAVLWAAENNITAGTAPDKFSPNMSCDRGQVVSFLYRMMA